MEIPINENKLNQINILQIFELRTLANFVLL